MTSGIYGDTTRELHRAWSKCMAAAGDGSNDDDAAAKAAEAGVVLRRTLLPNGNLRPLFNQVDLFPSQSQIFEMVQCAHECANQRSKSLSESSSSHSSSGESLRVSMTPPGGREGTASSSATTTTDRRSSSLTFGEFCVFATELKKYYNSHDSSSSGRHRGGHHHHKHHNLHHHRIHHSRHLRQQSPLKTSSATSSCVVASSSSVDKARRNELLRTQKSTASAYDVFLGGSCNPTTWRQDLAIPHLKTQGITYYNPQQSNWVPEMIELEHQAKQTSQIILLVMNEKTRNVVSNIEASYLAGANRRIIVVIKRYPRTGHSINGDPITEGEWQDLDGAFTTVHDLVERQGFPVFSDLQVALNCTSKVLKEGMPIESLGLTDQAQPVKLAHLQIGDKLVRLREAFDTLDTSCCGKLSLADIRMAFRIHAHRDLSQKDLRQIVTAHDVPIGTKGNSLPLDQVMINFDHFCCIVSEFKNNKHKKGGRSSGEGRSGRRNKASRVIRSVFHPIHKIASWISPSSSDSNGGSGSSSQDRQTSSSSPSPIPAATQLKQRRGSQMRDVYLGGTLTRSSRWREKEAIPTLKKHGLTFFTPSAPSRRLIPLEAAAMDNSRVLLFVIEGCARSVSAMCEAAYYIGLGATVVLCLQKIPEDATVSGERLSKCALKDYNRGRCYLSDFANREGVPVFEEVSEAVECILQKCKSLSR